MPGKQNKSNKAIVTISKRHHYTPRYYLSRFQDEDGALWRLDQQSAAITRGNKAHFGYKKHWNTLHNPPDGYQADWAEKRLSEVDRAASIILERILSGDLPKDIIALAYAISFMQNNQPRIKQDLQENYADKVQHWTDDFWLVARIKTALDSGQSYKPVHYSVQTIDEEDDDSRFLTSSNPLIEFENMPTKLLPLSSRHCLFLSYDQRFAGVAPRLVKCDRETVKGINRRTIENSWQYIYSCTPDFSA